MGVLADIEVEVEKALTPMLEIVTVSTGEDGVAVRTVSGGYLKKLRRFRGSADEIRKHYADPRPCAFVGIVGQVQMSAPKEGPRDMVVPVVLTVIDDNARGEAERVEGSTIDSLPGVYAMLEDAAALIERGTLMIDGQPRPIDANGMNIAAVDDNAAEIVGQLSMSVTVSMNRFDGQFRRVIGRQ